MKKFASFIVMLFLLAGSCLATEQTTEYFTAVPISYSVQETGSGKREAKGTAVTGLRISKNQTLWNCDQIAQLAGSPVSISFHGKTNTHGSYYAITNETGDTYAVATHGAYKIMENGDWLDIGIDPGPEPVTTPDGIFVSSTCINSIFSKVYAVDDMIYRLEDPLPECPFELELLGAHEKITPAWYTVHGNDGFQITQKDGEPARIDRVTVPDGLTYWSVTDAAKALDMDIEIQGFERSKAYSGRRGREGSYYGAFLFKLDDAEVEIAKTNILVREPGGRFRSRYIGEDQLYGAIVSGSSVYLSTDALSALFPNICVVENELRIRDNSVWPNCVQMDEREENAVANAMWQLFNFAPKYYNEAKENIGKFKAVTLRFQKHIAAFVWFYRPTVYLNHKILGSNGYNSKELAGVFVHELTHIKTRSNNEGQPVLEQAKVMLDLGIKNERIETILLSIGRQKRYETWAREAASLLTQQ